MNTAWQHPYVNLFKVFGVGQWKKCSKEGDVSSIMDREMKLTVFRVLGSIPAANYILIPKTSSQSLSLTGHYWYTIFKPLPSKFFVLHLEAVNSSGMVIRISFSNLFKEFKSTSTWLQFPFPVSPDKELTARSLEPPQWTLLKVDLKALLSKYLHTQYSYLKNVRICANLLVKGVFTSDFDYSPHTTEGSQYTQPLPREIALPLSKDERFCDKYTYVQFPPDPNDSGGGQRSSCRKLKGMHSQMSAVPPSEVRGVRDKKEHSDRSGLKSREDDHHQNASRSLPQSRDLESSQKLASLLSKESAEKVKGQHRLGDSRHRAEEVHVYGGEGVGVIVHREGVRSVTVKQRLKQEPQGLQPDPILRLNKVIGFGGHKGAGQVIFGGDGESVIYPCHSLVVNMDIRTGRQRLYIGHTDKVSCIALNGAGSVLASGQTGPLSLVRLWGVESASCLALFKTHSSGLHTLSFSAGGGVLCGVGRDSHGKGEVVLWSSAHTPHTGDVSVLTKAHTDVSIERMRIAEFDDSRLVSCGWDNVRFWRLRGGSLRSCPVNLERHHQMHFTDVQFQPGFTNKSDLTDRNVYVCTKSGHMFEIHYKTITVKRTWHLLPSNTGGVSIGALVVHEVFCVTGSDDGVLRVWPLDFSTVCMEAEHDGPVSTVAVSEDGLRILAGTSAGNLGVLDASEGSYTTLMRSHSDQVHCMSVTDTELLSPALVSCSSDHTIRVWDLQSGAQLFDFHAPGDSGSCVSWHPTQPVFACGFQSGAVRLFHTPSTSLLSEHKHHGGVVTGVVFSPDGHALYSSSSSGSLIMYNITDLKAAKVVRMLANTVAKGKGFGPRALGVSEGGGKLAFIGPLDTTVTVLEAHTLDEILRLDITPMSTPHTSTLPHTPPTLDTAKMVTFSPAALNQLLVITSSSRLLKFNCSNGQLLSEVSHIHRTQCTALGVDGRGRYLLTAGDSVVKVWDYAMALDLNFQVFIGHSGPITDVLFSPEGNKVISCGDAIFLWDFLGSATPHHSHTSTPPRNSQKFHPRSTSPRRSAPAPVNYEPIKMHSFTPLTTAPKHRPVTLAGDTLNVDDDTVYEDHSGGESPDPHSEERLGERLDSHNEERLEERLDRSKAVQGERPAGESNINVFKSRNLRERSDEGEPEEIAIQQEDDKLTVSLHPPPPSPPPHPSHPSLSSPVSQKHYRPSPPKADLAEHLYVAPPDQAGLRLARVQGVNGAARNNVLWDPSSGLFAYSSGCVVVMEDLSTGAQTHLLGHTEEVSTLAVQHDARDLASASPTFNSTPCEIRIWRVASAKCAKVLTVHSHSVQSMAYSRDDRLLLSIGTHLDGIVAVWNSHDYSLLSATPISQPVHEACWDPHRAYEFTSVGAGLKFWLVEEDRGGRTCELRVHEPEVPADVMNTKSRSTLEFTSLCYGSDPMLYIGTNNGVVTLWDTKENKCLMYWTTDLQEISTLYSSAGRLLTADMAGSMHLWTVEEGPPHSLPVVSLLSSMGVSGGVFSASFDSKLELGVVGTSSGAIYYINWVELSRVSIVSGHASRITCLAFSRDNSLLATAGRDGSLTVWRVDAMEHFVLFQAQKSACHCVAFAPPTVGPVSNEQGQGRASPSVVAGYGDGTLRVFDLEGIKMKRKIKPHSEAVRVVSFSNDGHVIISGCSSGVVAVTNSASGLVVRVITDHQGAPLTDIDVATTAAVLPGVDECHLWLVVSGDRRVSVWGSEWSKDRCLLIDWLTFPGPFFAPDGTRLKKGDKCQYDLLPPSLARFSPSNPDTIVYTGYGLEKCVQFYSISKKTVTRTCALTHWATAMDISPDGHLLAFGSEERVLKLMDSEEGSFQDYTGHHNSVDRVLFSPNGKYLISVSITSFHTWDITL